MLCIKDVVKNQKSYNGVLLTIFKLAPLAWLAKVIHGFNEFFFLFEETSQ
jgi:hypothetical protein